MGIEEDIERLTREIAGDANDPELYLARGEAWQRAAQRDKALNDFLRVLELDPQNIKAQEYVRMLREIFEYAYKEIYNP